jgi:hypothetical protein
VRLSQNKILKKVWSIAEWESTWLTDIRPVFNPQYNFKKNKKNSTILFLDSSLLQTVSPPT